MHPADIEICLESAVVLVDTREQPTKAFRKRMKSIGIPNIRKKLDFGDYSIMCNVNGKEYSLENTVSIERKMNFDELCYCYCQGRKRFTKEFDRAKEAGAKMYLLVENATWERAYDGDYRSLMSPSALVASITAWLTRYNCQLIFCKPETTGKLIREILYRELKERLKNLEL